MGNKPFLPLIVDQATRDRIVLDLDTSLLVEAGAGSGKTHEMASRMAAGVANGHYKLEEMAAVTFTRKAAAELRGRFQLALEAELSSSIVERGFSRADADAREARVRDALSNLERFFAGTIHSFCAHMLRARPVEAGVSPGFTEIDEVEDASLRKQAWRDFLVQARSAGDPTLQELREAGLKPWELDQAFEIVCNDEDVEFPPGDAHCPDVKKAWAALDSFWAAIAKELPDKTPADTNCKTQLRCRRFARELRIANTRRERPATLASLLDIWDHSFGMTQYQWSDDKAATKRLKLKLERLHVDFRNSVITPFITTWRRYLYRLVIDLLTRARAGAAAERRRRNALNYNDLLLLAAKMLRENAAVRRALQAKYRWLFVDEFQDTDPVQAEIIFLLAAEASAKAAQRVESTSLDWLTLPLRPGALFVVGDPKQSIYRFRRADIEIYNQVRQRLDSAPNGAVVSLTANFRSVPQLCEWGNKVFKAAFPPAPTSHSPMFAALSPVQPAGLARPAGDDKSGPPGVYILTVPADVDSSEVASTEAEGIARYIRSEVDAARHTWGDFLILTRKLSKGKRLLPYVEALEALQIPMEVSGAGAFAESKEVSELARLLRALSDPQDSVALVGVLRGAFFGVSDPDLFTWKQSGGWFSIFAEVPEVPVVDISRVRLQPDHPVATALASLKTWFGWTRTLPAGAAVEKILEDSGYLALAATTPDGVEAGDLLHAVDRVRRVVEWGGSLADAASALEADDEAAADVESLPLEPGRSDVVRLMNLHKAKGLEAPVVFLADPCGGRWRHVSRRIVRDGKSPRGWFSIEPKREGERGSAKVIAQPDGWDVHVQQELAYLDAEETRLLYVAATRAKEVLVIGRHAKPGGERAWSAFDPFLAGAPELPMPARVAKPTLRKVNVSVEARKESLSARTSAHHLARTPSWSATSVTAEARHIAKMSRAAEPVVSDDPTRVVSTNTPSHRADAGIAWGTLVHGLLEHAMRHTTATRDDLRRLAMWLTMEQLELRPVIDDALDTVEGVARASFWEDAKASGERHEEVPFARRITVQDPLQVLSGTIDLVYKRPSDWRLLDYKTDGTATAADLKARYQQQIDAYADAWESLAGGKVSAELISTRRTQSTS